MPSSKFSSRPPARKRPYVCKKPPPGSDPALPETPLPQINAFVDQADNDPAAPSKQQANFQLHWNKFANEFRGRSGRGPERLALTLIPQSNPNLYDARLDVWDTARLPETFHYYNIYIPSDKPFASPKFGDVWISGQDYRVIQVSE